MTASEQRAMTEFIPRVIWNWRIWCLIGLGRRTMNEIRWTDKVYLDSQGNIRSSDGCPTDLIAQDLINKVMTNIGCARPIVSGKEKKNERNSC